ncbi:MAG: glycosyltransferase [Oscillospiraceae bacterium]|nr:glycosyltransferase [Oscillospiraceae bacterium]
MGLAAKAIKKLGLGDAAGRLLAPLAHDAAPLPTAEEAEALLASLHPDTGRSALFDAPLPPAEAGADVDVIIPVYNAEKYLDACLDSVLSQETECAFRVIAVDDGSADRSGALLDARADGKLTVLHQPNAGAAAARNRGLAESRAPRIFFLDADDLMSPGCLQAMLGEARERGADLLEAGYSVADAEGRTVRTVPHKAGALDLRRDLNGFPPGKLYARRFFDRIRFPEGYRFEDSVLSQLLMPWAEREGLRAFGLDREAFLYRVHPQSTGHRNHGSAHSIDAVWVTRALHRDRLSLGLENDQPYYEYLLNSLVLSMRRTEALGDEVMRAVFVLYRELLASLEGFSTERSAYRQLEQAVRGGDFGLCRLFSSLH